MFWKHNMVCNVFDSSQNHIDIRINERNDGEPLESLGAGIFCVSV